MHKIQTQYFRIRFTTLVYVSNIIIDMKKHKGFIG